MVLIFDGLLLLRKEQDSKQHVVSMVTCRLAFAIHKGKINSIYLHFQGFCAF